MYKPKHALAKPKKRDFSPADCVALTIEGKLAEFKSVMDEYPELINMKDEKGNVPIHVACSKGDREMVELMIRTGADLEIQDMYGNSPLLYAIDKEQLDIVKLLIKRGVSVHETDFRGNSPLHSACAVNNLEIVEILLDRGSDPEARDYANQLPAHRTASRPVEETIRRAIENLKDGGESQSQKIVNYMGFGIGLGVGLGMALAKQQEMYAQQLREEEKKIKESADAKRAEMNARLKKKPTEEKQERQLL